MGVALPPGCVTGVGSLPFVDPQEAVRFVADHCPVLPFWPQLPRRHPSEGVIPQGLGRLAAFLEPAAKPFCWQVRSDRVASFASALKDDDAPLDPESAAGFFELENAIRAGSFPNVAAFKAQSAGPATVAHCVFVDGKPLATQPDWLELVTTFSARQAVWQVDRLRNLGKPVVFVLDEPAIRIALSCASADRAAEIVAAIATVLRAVRNAGAAAGLHCCAPLPIEGIQTLDLDFVSFDAHLPLDGANWLDFAASVLARSGHLAFGLVPTGPAPTPGTDELFALWLRLAAAAGDLRTVAERTVVTATCGLGLATPERAGAAFEACRQLGDRIQQSAECVDV
jgi:hypothetical protein